MTCTIGIITLTFSNYFGETTLEGAKLKGAILTGADLSGADLRGVKIYMLPTSLKELKV